MISENDVKKIALLARLEFAPERLKVFTKQFNDIMGYVQQLEKVDVSGVEPMSQVHGLVNVFREDKLEPHLDTKEALQNAPNVCGQFIRVPLIVEQE